MNESTEDVDEPEEDIMGASEFWTVGRGKTAKEAFAAAQEEARYENGHGGYSGTIAEKSSFLVVNVPEGRTGLEVANDLVEKDDRRVSDKFGPACCVKLAEGEWLFFGMASC